jgi:hypothetical protein
MPRKAVPLPAAFKWLDLPVAIGVQIRPSEEAAQTQEVLGVSNAKLCPGSMTEPVVLLICAMAKP